MLSKKGVTGGKDCFPSVNLRFLSGRKENSFSVRRKPKGVPSKRKHPVSEGYFLDQG
jgi:hypothetical protein